MKQNDHEKLVKDKLKTCFPTVPKEKIENTSERITYLAGHLSSIPLCENTAIGIGLSIETAAKEIADENGHETRIIYDIIIDVVKHMKS